MSETNEELDRFRQKWREEVTARSRVPQVNPSKTGQTTIKRDRNTASHPASEKSTPLGQAAAVGNDDGVLGESQDLEDVVDATRPVSHVKRGSGGYDEAWRKSTAGGRQLSALEHFEMAVEKEARGNLGESLEHYRKAYRLDDRIDQKYKTKHFPLARAGPQGTGRPAASTYGYKEPPSSSEIPAQQSSRHLEQGALAPSGSADSTVSSLILSYQDERISPAPPLIARTPPKPCPISTLPSELLADILAQAMLADIACSARLALVCRRLTYLVATEDSIWRRICEDGRFGFAGMHYKFAKRRKITIASSGTRNRLVTKDDDDDDDDDSEDDDFGALSRGISELSVARMTTIKPSVTLPLTQTYPTYRAMFRHRPRLRFGGVYISTVNYTRPGASSANQVSWNTPVHIVTYYRYLRFYRDGECLSLLTTTEPEEVVPLLHRSNLGNTGGSGGSSGSGSSGGAANFGGNGSTGAAVTQGGVNSAAPGPAMVGSIMKYAHRGRWRLSSPHELLQRAAAEKEASSTDASTTLAPQPHDPQSKAKISATDNAHEPEGNVYIETAGPTPAYMYSMQLVLRSSGGGGGGGGGGGIKAASADAGHGHDHHAQGNNLAEGPRNTKLVWRGFWSYNRLTDDWGEFQLRNDRAFVWSRVRSWADS